jgi:hypothetical protein
MSDLVSPCPFASLEGFAMLTPVTPNPIATSTTIKTHGSESRATAGQNPAEAQVVPLAAAHNAGIGLDAGTILANVNAEAATAGNRTILQTLALAVAAQLNIVRRNDETMDAFFLRIAATIDEMLPDEALATEARAGLKLLKISLPELSAALKQPDSPLAARLSAIAETPMATPQKTAAAVATTTYLQETASNSRAAETLAMATQSRSNPEGAGLFSSNAPGTEQRQPSDARSLQMQLKSLFEPGIAETRIEIADKPEPAKALILRTDGEFAEAPAAAAQEPTEGAEITATLRPQSETSDPVAAAQPEQPAVEPEIDQPLASSRPAEAKQAAADIRPANSADSKLHASATASAPTETSVIVETVADRKQDAQSALPRPEPRMIGLPLSQSNNSPSLAMRIRTIAQELAPNKTPIDDEKTGQRTGSDQRVQTLLALKGIAEVVMPLPAKAEEAAAATPQEARLKSDHANGEVIEKATTAAEHLSDDGTPADAVPSPAQAARKDAADGRHIMPASQPENEDASQATTARGAAGSEAPAGAKAPEAQAGAALKTTAGNLDPVPFAYAALQPAKDEFKAEAVEDQGRQEEDDDAGRDQQREDPEARRERLARKAVDDLLRPEPDDNPEVKITRDSSQADRAYALYQRMGGF